jgi:hypothetical protein
MAKGVKALFAKVSVTAALTHLSETVINGPAYLHLSGRCLHVLLHSSAPQGSLDVVENAATVRALWLALERLDKPMHAARHMLQVIQRRSTSAGMPASPAPAGAGSRWNTAAGYMSDDSVNEEVEAVQQQHGMIRHDSGPSSLSQTPNSSTPGSMVSC